MATISAWAVGSLAEVTQFHPSARIAPSLTITAPKGPPAPASIFSRDRAMARRMNSSGRMGLASPRVLRSRARRITDLQQLGSDGERDLPRVLAADAGDADRTGKTRERSRRNAALAQPADETRPLGLRPDQ